MTALLAGAHPAGGGRAVPEETFGARLKRLRERAGLTQGQLGSRAGVNQYSIAKLEQDQYSPTWLTVLAIAKVLGVSIAVFEDTVPPTEAQKAQPRKRGRPKKQPPATAKDAPPCEEKPKRWKGKKS